MIFKIHTDGKEALEIADSSIRHVEVVHHNMVQIIFNDDSVKELHFLPVETAANQAQKACDILSGTIDISVNSIQPR
jgi:hypothetical protein